MKFVFASDSFKGSLSSEDICGLLETAAHAAFPSAECVPLLIADGGEGTLDAIAAVRAGECVSVQAHDGLLRSVQSDVFLCGDQAFVEAAASCGLTMLAENERNPLATSSYGVGECIRFALDRGCRHITIGLGGSCTNDGGMGCLRALGVRFLDAEGCELMGYGADLACVKRIDASGLHPEVPTTQFTIMSDVTNPLLGSIGATRVFGRQKGAGDAMLDQLEVGMQQYAHRVLEVYPDVDMGEPGYGAAGGLGMALSVFLGAQMKSGIEELLRWVDFDTHLQGADLVVTGEGRLDNQSLDGKVVSVVAAHAKRAGVPVAVICGASTLTQEQLRNLGVAPVLQTAKDCGAEYAMAHASETYAAAARELFESIRSDS